MIKIGICDDDERELSRITELLVQYRNKRELDFQCKSFCSATELLSGMKGGEFDLILLDVLMPGLNGMQAAREIRNIDQKVKLLFLSSSSEFAVESYAVGAFHYLLKPVKAENLFALLDKALTDLNKQDESGLTLKGRTGFTHIPFSRLEYVEVVSKTVCFHLADGSVVETFGAMAAFEAELLEQPEFIKVHRSYLVNLQYVETLDRNVICTRLSHQIPVARALCTQIKEAYMRYLFAAKQAELPSTEQADSVSPSTNDGVYRILLVDDEPSELSRWGGILCKKGCEVRCAPNANEAQLITMQEHFDCVVIDVMLSGEDGFVLGQTLRNKTGAPVIFLSCLTDPASQMKGFLSGGVDYITKDTSSELFWTKVETRIRLSRGKRSQLLFAPLLLDQNERRVLLDGQDLPITPTEFNLLWELAEHSGQIFTIEELHRAVQGDDRWENPQSVQSHMSRLRRKLEKIYPAHYFIETVWGEGYRFAPCEAAISAAK